MPRLRWLALTVAFAFPRARAASSHTPVVPRETLSASREAHQRAARSKSVRGLCVLLLADATAVLRQSPASRCSHQQHLTVLLPGALVLTPSAAPRHLTPLGGQAAPTSTRRAALSGRQQCGWAEWAPERRRLQPRPSRVCHLCRLQLPAVCTVPVTSALFVAGQARSRGWTQARPPRRCHQPPHGAAASRPVRLPGAGFTSPGHVLRWAAACGQPDVGACVCAC